MKFGSLPAKRAVPDFARKQSTEELLLKTLRRQGEAEAESRKRLQSMQKRADSIAEKLALQVHKKRFSSNDPFIQSLRQLLKSEGITLITHVGEAVTEALEEETDIVEWLPADNDAGERVVDALEPEIRWQGRILRRAKLSCRMAAGDGESSEETAPESSEENTPAQEEKAHFREGGNRSVELSREEETATAVQKIDSAEKGADEPEPDAGKARSQDDGFFCRALRQLAGIFRAVTNPGGQSAEETAPEALNAEFEADIVSPVKDAPSETKRELNQLATVPGKVKLEIIIFCRRVFQWLSKAFHSVRNLKEKSVIKPVNAPESQSSTAERGEKQEGDNEHVNQ